MKRRGFIASLLTAAVTPWESLGRALEEPAEVVASPLAPRGCNLTQQDLADHVQAVLDDLGPPRFEAIAADLGEYMPITFGKLPLSGKAPTIEMDWIRWDGSPVAPTAPDR